MKARLALLLAVVFVPIMIVTAYALHNRYQTSRERELQANLELARAVGKAFETFVYDVLHQELAIGIAITASPPLSDQDIQRLLDESAREFPSVRHFNWVSPAGIVLASSPPNLVGFRIDDRPSLKEILSGREWSINDLVLAVSDGSPIITIDRGIRNHEGTLLGIVHASINPDRLDSVLAINRTSQGAVSLVDKKGMLVYRYPHVTATWEERNLLKTLPYLNRVLAGEEVTDIVVTPYEKYSRIVASVPMKPIGWSAGAGSREEDVLKPIVSNIFYQSGIFLGVAVLSLLAALSIARSISNPASRLRKHALSLGGEDSIERIEPSGAAELQDLAYAFNDMAERVRKSRDELELRVEERTAELSRANERLQEQADLLDLAPDALLLCGLDDRIKYWNHGAELTCGFTQKEAVGSIPRDLLQSQYSQPFEEIKKTVLTEGSWAGEIRQTTRDGRSIIVESRWTLQRDTNGNPRAFLELNRDITQRKKAEIELESYAFKLEYLNRELQDFTSVASHDLQEPLRKIITFGGLLKSKCVQSLGETGDNHLDRIVAAATRMRTLLDALLDYSRVTTKAVPFTLVNLEQIVLEVMEDLEVRIAETGGTVELGSLPIIEADPHQVRQLFQNLIGNALKYHGQRKPVVKINSGEIDGGEAFRITVEDNGIGFDEKYLDSIFAPFQRLHSRSEYEGVGMGLAICKKILERHGGSITAQSHPDEGSTFIVTFPVTQQTL